MSKFYTFIWDGVATSRLNINKEFISSCFIFVPFLNTSTSKNATYGTFLSPKDVFWHDPTGCVDKVKEVLQCIQKRKSDFLPCEMLSSVYPGLREFFVQVCHVHEVPPFGSYLQILLQLSSVTLPSQAAHAVSALLSLMVSVYIRTYMLNLYFFRLYISLYVCCSQEHV